jgi:ribosomal protein S18 acetylase RimI-like enzyme
MDHLICRGGIRWTVQRAEAADADRIVLFEAVVTNRKLYGKPLDHAAALKEIKANEYYCLICDGRVFATGACRRQSDASAYLSNIAVHPQKRRQGLVRALLMHLLRRCIDASSIDLAVHPENHPARALYASVGFVPKYCKDNFFGDGEPRLIMTRSHVGTAVQ